MTNQAVRGFTIIEVMLFLAVTGLLTTAMLAASSGAIAHQRYRDSVSSFKSLIQEQYGQATNVVNGEASNPACVKRGSSLILDDGRLTPRGTSDCLLLGRYLLVEPTKVTSFDVIGQPLTNEPGSNDIEALRNYIFRTSDEADTEDVAWGATIVRPRTNTGMTVSVAMLRSPLSGSVVTFVRDGNRPVSTLISSGYMVQKDFCFEPYGGSVSGGRLAVRLNAGATGQSSVEIPLATERVCD